MHYLTPDEVKSEELAILEVFAACCHQFGLHYSLAGGTLLGAVRHKGFIPWDDDIDVSMPRPDFEALCSLDDSELIGEGLRLDPFRGTAMSGTPYVKIVNPKIAVLADVEAHPEPLWIDVLPVDGLPEDRRELEEMYRTAKHLRTQLVLSGVKASSGSSIPKKVAKAVLKVPLSLPGVSARIGRKLSDFGKSIEYGSTPYVGILTWGLYGAGERMPLEGFQRQAQVEFEGRFFTCMACWDEYLTGIYGNYMQLPPVERRSSHGLRAWYTEGEQ